MKLTMLSPVYLIWTKLSFLKLNSLIPVSSLEQNNNSNENVFFLYDMRDIIIFFFLWSLFFLASIFTVSIIRPLHEIILNYFAILIVFLWTSVRLSIAFKDYHWEWNISEYIQIFSERLERPVPLGFPIISWELWDARRDKIFQY